MTLLVGTKVHFYEPYRPSQVLWGVVGVIVYLHHVLDEWFEQVARPRLHRGAPDAARTRVLGTRAFRRFITPWIEEWQLSPACLCNRTTNEGFGQAKAPERPAVMMVTVRFANKVRAAAGRALSPSTTRPAPHGPN
jgi:hypothetical protein